MKFTARILGLLCASVAVAGLGSTLVKAAPKPEIYWQVDDVRAGMKGQGRTVIKGTKIESFDFEVLGVMRNTSPGRDMVLCRLSGLNLDKTGVIAGMSGSPVYIQGKLLGAVAYAWPYGKEPIAGVTPFSQMAGFVESYERRDLAEKHQPRRIGLGAPVRVEGKDYDTVTVTNDFSEPRGVADGLWMMPLRTPLTASGMSPRSLDLLGKQLGHLGLVPMQGGAVGGNVPDQERNVSLAPGSALCVGLIQGDFDLSAIGTVTHIDGKRVYGFGHPFFSLGSCDFPLMTGLVHTIYPRLSLSFKMGSPLRTVGIINADVSTCIAGWLDRKPDMLPVRMTVGRSPEPPRTFNVQVARQRTMIGPLVFTALNNSVDMEGDLPEEMTAHLKMQIDIEGRAPVIINDLFSGGAIAGGRAPQALYNQVGAVVNLLTFNSYKPLRINRIDCDTQIEAIRRTADIEAIELDATSYAPGETIKGVVFLRPYKELRQRVPVTLKLPADLPEGNYTITVGDDMANAKHVMRDNPYLNNPQSLDHVFDALKVITSVQRTNVVLRLPLGGTGVAVDGKTLPDLPPGMVQILSSSRRTGAQALNGALVSRTPTSWVVQGSESVRITVAKHKNQGRFAPN